MKASVPFDFSDADRALIARFLGYDRPASHIECVAWARQQLHVALHVMSQAAPRNPHGLNLTTRPIVGGAILE